MQKGWLAYAGPYRIEQTPGTDYAGDIDLGAPAKGVLHTTEGGWDGSMSVFRTKFSPHFLVDRGRIAQLLPLGRAASTLKRPNGTPTNGVCRAQIEIVGYSQASPWLPPAETVDALARLMAELERVADIPLRYVRADRNPGVFASASGWVGHADVPGNEHWDPGKLEWDRLLSKARGYSAAAGFDLTSRTGYWSWLAWYLGEGDWKPHGPRNPRVRPNVPRRLPRAWWARLRVFRQRRK